MKEPSVLILGILLAVMSAAICMQIMGQLGTAPNTSLIGVVLVMIVARIPLMTARRFRNPQRQNYVISIASAAGFTAANCGFVAIATMFILGKNDLIVPVAFGALVGSMISVSVIGRIFDSKIFPAGGAWPMGQAIATAIQAGDEGGKKGFQLLQGLAVGAIASFLGIPAAGVGIAFI
ncbi:MAG: OPT/YSL family transporter, partial [Defluviitaleaceae bacterium]|nr:OPT/YSL family transporter [Defluviitaleaceae bacterium]